MSNDTAEQLIAHYAAQGSAPGFFLEIQNRESPFKSYGIQEVSQSEVEKARVVGVYGRREVDFTEPFEVIRGPNLVTIKASAKKPLRCWEYLYCHG